MSYIKLQSLESHILIRKNYVMALYKKLSLLRIEFALKNEYERNEIDVIYYETLIKISSIERQIISCEKSYKEYLKLYKENE